MESTKRKIWFIGLAALVVWVGVAYGAEVPEPGPGFYVENPDGAAKNHNVLNCDGIVQRVIDAGDETLHTTTAIFGTSPGGGEGRQFDPTPVLTIKDVKLDDGECLNAHLSVLTGSAQTYGVAPLTLFQVTLTPTDGSAGPQHMVGHYETPYGILSPAVALEAERDVDMFAANFFQKTGDREHEIRPGSYNVDVWWAGAPPGVPGGGIAAAFVLKLYLRD